MTATQTAPMPFAACDKAFLTKVRDAGLDASVIYDIGGSNGGWSAVMADVYPEARYELFEPLAQRRDDYAGIYRGYAQEHPRFHMHAIALGEQDGDAEFWNEPHGVGASLLVGNVPPDQRIRVPVRRLDAYVAEQRLPQPQIIKVDVQGGEGQVIRGGTETFARAEVLVLETWLRRGYGKQTPLISELIEQLMPLGFMCVELGDFYRKPDQEFISVDAFFAHRRFIERVTGSGRPYPWRAAWEG